MQLEKRSLLYVFLILLLLLAFIPAASAENVNTYTFNVTPGDNILNFNKTYDGRFVSAINGSFIPTAGVPGDYMKVIEFHAAETRNDVLVNITIHGPMSGINSDWTNVWFYYPESFTKIPFYISTHNATAANFTLRVDAVAGDNSVLFVYGGNSINNEIDASSVYLFYLNESGGVFIDSSTIFFEGVYTDIIFRMQPIPTEEIIVREIIMGDPNSVQNRTPFILMTTVTRSGVQRDTLQFNFNGTLSNFVTNADWNDTSYFVSMRYHPLNGTITGINTRFIQNTVAQNATFRSDAATDLPFRSFSITRDTITTVYPPQLSTALPTTIFDVRIFNTTEITLISVGHEIEINPRPLEPTPLSIPSGHFSSIRYSASSSGSLLVDVFYEPHVILITPNNKRFGIENVRLEYISNPADFQITFQISDTSDFSHVIISGATSGGLITINDFQLESGAYYWRIIQPDGTFTDTRRFTVTEQEESGYPLALLIIPFIFAVWPILSRRSNRNPTETFVAITMGTIACLTIAYMLMAGIIIGGITYNTMFLAFPMIPVCFYYLYMFLKNVIDNKEKVRKPIS